MVCLITNVQLYFPGMIFSQWRLPRGLPQTKFREIILVENYKYYRPGGGGVNQTLAVLDFLIHTQS